MKDKGKSKGKDKSKGKKKSKGKDKDNIIVVASRIIDTVAHSEIVDRGQCEECKEMVWLSVNWRGKKVDKIICDHCFKKENYEDDDFSTNITEACLNDAIKYVRTCMGMTGTDEEISKRIIKIMEERIGEKINIIK